MSEEKKNENVVDDASNEEQSEQAEEVQGQEELSLEQQLENALAESAELRDKLLRVAADSENFKKRIDRERLATLRYAGENIFKEILPALDNMERALDAGVVEGADAEQSLKALHEGIELTRKSLVSSLQKFEVKAIDSVGQPFDPKHHEALTMEASETVAANHILNEFEKGYYYKDRLLRAAKVIVSSGKQE